MKNHWALVWLTCTVIFCLVGCAPPPAPTEVSQLPATSLNPTATDTPLPPTATLEPTATKIPRPTWTRVPHGTFKGCIYYEGKLVRGAFKFFNDSGFLENLTKQLDSSGCATISLLPGKYEVHGTYWRGPCATETGCYATPVIFVMEADGIFEMDFDVVPIGQ